MTDAQQILQILKGVNMPHLETVMVKRDGTWAFHASGTPDASWLALSGIDGIQAICHTHVATSNAPIVPSLQDMQMFLASDITQGIAHWGGGNDQVGLCFWGEEYQATEESLLGREYRWGDYGSDGKGDCYALIHDYHRVMLGNELPKVPRQYGTPFQYETAIGLHAGLFTKVKTPYQRGDIIVLRHQGQEHGMVYHGDGKVYHHQEGRRSCVTHIKTYERLVSAVYRYNG